VAAENQGYNRSLGVLRVLSVYVLFGALVLLAKPTPLSVSIGFVFVALGEAVRFWAAGHLHKTVLLITSGPYRYTRNPLYLGRLLIFTGIAIMTLLPYRANWIVLGFGYLVFFGYYMPRKERVEPARLTETHGQAYTVYFKAVPALFPRLTPWPDGAREGWYSSRMRRNREHWMVVGLSVITLLLLWKAYSKFDFLEWLQ
jgi:protein-S-isoprenylcysteine O-methyltransferase Ste14